MTSSAGQGQAQAAQGLFGFQGLMDDFYGYQPEGDDDEGRALKRGFQADMINKFANSQLSMAQAAQAQQYSLDSMQSEADLTLRNQTQTNKQMFDYGMAEMGAKYDYESRMAVDDAARELNRMSTAGTIQQNQTRLEGSENRLNIGAQTEGAKDLQKLVGDQAVEQIDVSAAADIMKAGGTARQLQGDQLSSAERMQTESLGSAQDMQTEALGAADVQQQRQLTSEENRQTEQLAAADVQQIRGGEQAIEQIKETGTQTRTTMREDEDIKMNQQNRASARSKALARR